MYSLILALDTPDNKVHGANMGPIWGRQDPGGPHVGPMNLAIWDLLLAYQSRIDLCGTSCIYIWADQTVFIYSNRPGLGVTKALFVNFSII